MQTNKLKSKYMLRILAVVIIALSVAGILIILLSPKMFFGFLTNRGFEVSLNNIGNTSPVTNSKITIGSTDYNVAANAVAADPANVPNSLLNPANSSITADLSTAKARVTTIFWLVFLTWAGLAVIVMLILWFKPCLLLACCPAVPTCFGNQCDDDGCGYNDGRYNGGFVSGQWQNMPNQVVDQQQYLDYYNWQQQNVWKGKNETTNINVSNQQGQTQGVSNVVPGQPGNPSLNFPQGNTQAGVQGR